MVNVIVININFCNILRMKNPYTLIWWNKEMTKSQIELNNSKFWEWENRILEKQKLQINKNK